MILNQSDKLNPPGNRPGCKKKKKKKKKIKESEINVQYNSYLAIDIVLIYVRNAKRKNKKMKSLQSV